jgi:hypothetical protein
MVIIPRIRNIHCHPLRLALPDSFAMANARMELKPPITVDVR